MILLVVLPVQNIVELEEGRERQAALRLAGVCVGVEPPACPAAAVGFYLCVLILPIHYFVTEAVESRCRVSLHLSMVEPESHGLHPGTLGQPCPVRIGVPWIEGSERHEALAAQAAVDATDVLEDIAGTLAQLVRDFRETRFPHERARQVDGGPQAVHGTEGGFEDDVEPVTELPAIVLFREEGHEHESAAVHDRWIWIRRRALDQGELGPCSPRVVRVQRFGVDHAEDHGNTVVSPAHERQPSDLLGGQFPAFSLPRLDDHHVSEGVSLPEGTYDALPEQYVGDAGIIDREGVELEGRGEGLLVSTHDQPHVSPPGSDTLWVERCLDRGPYWWNYQHRMPIFWHRHRCWQKTGKTSTHRQGHASCV